MRREAKTRWCDRRDAPFSGREQTAGIAPVMPEMEVDVHQAGHEGDDVLETEREFNYEGYQVVRREFFAHINEPSVTFNNYKFM